MYFHAMRNDLICYFARFLIYFMYRSLLQSSRREMLKTNHCSVLIVACIGGKKEKAMYSRELLNFCFLIMYSDKLLPGESTPQR